MDPKDLPPLRAGLGLPGRAVAPSTEGQESLAKRLISTVSVMTQHAGCLAYQICMHANRGEVTPDDVNAALKYQARHFLQTVDSPDVMQEIDEMEKVIFVTESVGSNDSDDDIETDTASEEEEVTLTDEQDYRDGKCMCATCIKVREAVDSWDAWEPTDEAEVYLKDSVNRAIASAAKKSM